MTSPTDTAEAPARRRRGRPRGEPFVLVQPPAKYAHLAGDELTDALLADDEEWDSARAAAEIGRSVGRFRVMVSYRYAVDDGRRKLCDRTAPRPFAGEGVHPRWRAGDFRRWAMAVGLMYRDGTFKPHKPGGKGTGWRDVNPRRRRPTPAQAQALQVLDDYRLLREPDSGGRRLSAKVAKDYLALRYGLSERQVVHRLYLGRKATTRQDTAEQSVGVPELVGTAAGPG